MKTTLSLKFLLPLIMCAALFLCLPCFCAGAENQTAGDETDLSGLTMTVKARTSGANTKISWKKISGADYYKVWRKEVPDGTKQRISGKRTGKTFTDKNAKSGQAYIYYVRAFNDSSRSKFSSSGEFTTVTRVYVETGHGTGEDGAWDPGCSWNGYQEAKLMIPIAKATCDCLKDQGVYVYTDAYDGNNRNLNYTLRFLDSHSVSAFLNIHCDAAFEDPGTLALFRTKTQKKLAKALNKGVHQFVDINDRGLEKRTDLTTLNSSKVHCPACLFEIGNIKKDNKALRKKTGALGKGLAKGLCDYLGIAFEE